MAKDTSKISPLRGLRKGGKRRRTVVTVRRDTLRDRLRELIERPTLGWGVMMIVALSLFAAGAMSWTRAQPLVDLGQVMRETRTVRVAFSSPDVQETEARREAERAATPRVFYTSVRVLDEIGGALESLPRTLAGVDSLEAVEPSIRTPFGLSEERFGAVRTIGLGETSYAGWRTRVDALIRRLELRPMLDATDWQRATQEGLDQRIRLQRSDGSSVLVDRSQAINIGDAATLASAVDDIVRDAGFDGLAAEVVRHRLAQTPRATYSYDATATTEAQESRAARVEPVVDRYPVGQVIFRRGDALDQSQLDLFQREMHEFREQATPTGLWMQRLGLLGAALAVIASIAAYIAAYCPRIARRPARMAWLGGLCVAALGTACIGAVNEPAYMNFAAATPVVLVAILVCVAYERRTAVIVATGLALLVCLALRQPIPLLAVLLAGIGTATGRLFEVRDRGEVVAMSLWTGAVLLVVGVIAGLIDRPLSPISLERSLSQTMWSGVQAGTAGIVAGGVTLFVLPLVERIFDITTGMTLIELRDPKNPLLREMQQRAPGTYNHSLNVASIAESAAEAIGGDGLLTYVGCLYHDIGKINKPEYFVENQSGGLSKHDKLSPAMSLLVIVGHVKDGVEMARENGLPKTLQHFIEAHHGTTLVEYFYHRARKQALETSEEGEIEPAHGEMDHEDERLPDEVDYRYPGPKPQSKEVAIVMLSDAVESATRTLAEPTPARIDALVRELANKRLMDGQFDECDLTLRELRTICDSISKSVASIYHGRIKYPGGDAKPKTETKTDASGKAGGDEPQERTA